MFEVLWKLGDKTWMPYEQAKQLHALTEYLEAVGISDVKSLPHGASKPPLTEQALHVGAVGAETFYFPVYKELEVLDEFSLPIPTAHTLASNNNSPPLSSTTMVFVMDSSNRTILQHGFCGTMTLTMEVYNKTEASKVFPRIDMDSFLIK